MKPQSPFTHAMDGLRPRPARRTVMLQRILDTRQPPLSLRQWRWVLAGVPAVMVLALGLAWSLGAYDASRAAMPDKVTQAAAVATAPQVQAANPNNGKVQWLPNVTLASAQVANNLPDTLTLERRSPAELTSEEIQTIATNLEARGWSSVKVSVIREGYYQLSARKANAEQDALSTFFTYSDVEEVLGKRDLQLNSDPPSYAGLSMVLPGGGGISSSGGYDDNSKVSDAVTQFFLYKETVLHSVAVLPLDQAIKNAFYILGGHPALDTSKPLVVKAVKLLCASGVPYYQFPIQTENGTRFAYALAVAEKDLQPQPELYQNYQNFLAGKSAVLETLLESPTDVGTPSTVMGMETPIDSAILSLEDGVGKSLPQAGALFYTTSGILLDPGLQRMVESLQQKGWKTVSPVDRSEDGLLLRSANDGKAVNDAEQHRKLADQYIADSGLVQLLGERGYILSTTPSQVAQGETQYDLRPKSGLTILPGFVRLRLASDKSVVECRIQMKHIELLKMVTLRPLSQCLADVFAFSFDQFDASDAPAVQNGLSVTDARLIYVRGIPIYKMTIFLTGTKNSFTGYALAITMDELEAFPQALGQYMMFMQEGEETTDALAISVVDPTTGELSDQIFRTTK